MVSIVVNYRGRILFFVLLCCVPAGFRSFTHAEHRDSNREGIYSESASSFGRLPLSFEANSGQAEEQVRFLSHGPNYSLQLTDHEAVFAFSSVDLPRSTSPSQPVMPDVGISHSRKIADQIAGRQAATQCKTSILRMELVGALANPIVTGDEQLAGIANYFLGDDPSRWHTAIPTYGKVRYLGVYPGVELVFYGNQQQLEYDFVVAPHADPSKIRLHFEGASRLAVTSGGDLAIQTTIGEIAFHKPAVYQRVGSATRSIDGGFNLDAGETVSFHLGDYDRSQPLVIDPILVYSTFVGYGEVQGMGLDAAGEVVITGLTGVNFPTTTGSYQSTDPNPGVAAAIFVAKLNAEGSALVYSTYLGGKAQGDIDTYSNGIAVDSDGNAYIVGTTDEPDYPKTKSAFRTAGTMAKTGTGFVTKLDPKGSKLLYSTYLGGTKTHSTVPGDWLDISEGIAIDTAGDAFVVGMTTTKDFPVTSGVYQPDIKPQNTRRTCTVSELNPDGSGLVYATYLGGSLADECSAIAVDGGGNTSVGGFTQSNDYPTTAGAVEPRLASGIGGTGMLSKLNAKGTKLLYSTYLGGESNEVTAIAVDTAGNVYATGAGSSGFPTTAGAFKPHVKRGALNAFVTKFRENDMSLAYSTFIGGSLFDLGYGIAADSEGNAYVTGDSESTDFPITPGAFVTINYAHIFSPPSAEPFLAKLNESGTKLLYSTYLGGSGSMADDPTCGCAKSVAVDREGNAYLTGMTFSEDFPTTPEAFMTTLEADHGFPPYILNEDAPYVMKLNASAMRSLAPTTTRVAANVNRQVVGKSVTFTARVKAKNGGSTPTGMVGFDLGAYIWVVETLDSTGTARYVAPSSDLPVGSWSMVVIYLGDDEHAPSNASMVEDISDIPTGGASSASAGVDFVARKASKM